MTDIERFHFGRRVSDGVVGLWISKPGKDVSSTNPDDFLFDPSKYMARAFARYTTAGIWTRGAFERTITYSDFTRSDNYFYNIFFPLPFGYVPLVIAQLGSDVANAPTGGIFFNASGISLKIGAFSAYRYQPNDASKTPIAGSVGAGFDTVNNTYTSPSTVTKSTFIVYRNPLF